MHILFWPKISDLKVLCGCVVENERAMLLLLLLLPLPASSGQIPLQNQSLDHAERCTEPPYHGRTQWPVSVGGKPICWGAAECRRCHAVCAKPIAIAIRGSNPTATWLSLRMEEWHEFLFWF